MRGDLNEGWLVLWVDGREVFTHVPTHIDYVRAGAGDSVDFEYQPKIAGLPVLKLTKKEGARAVVRQEKRERREQRALRARGLA